MLPSSNTPGVTRLILFICEEFDSFNVECNLTLFHLTAAYSLLSFHFSLSFSSLDFKNRFTAVVSINQWMYTGCTEMAIL